MNSCNFCDLDNSFYYNKIIEETSNFFVIPSIGSLLEGYVMIVAKEHVNSMIELDDECLKEYINLIEKYRNIFKELYGKYPIAFEHGTPDINGFCTSCVIHAHTHIVNHNYKNEEEMYKKLNFSKIDSINDIENKNYIYYKNPSGEEFITYNFEPIRQMMRLYIAKDLGIEEKYNWRQYPFEENIRKTIEKLGNI